MYPSVKTLSRYWDKETATRIRKVLDGRTDPITYMSVANWVGQCYHRPSDTELKLAAVNEILEGFGVEAIFGQNIAQPDFSYVNMGDTYTPTVAVDYTTWNPRFIACSWGGWLESRERRGHKYT